jgi:hypothetical protein
MFYLSDLINFYLFDQVNILYVRTDKYFIRLVDVHNFLETEIKSCHNCLIMFVTQCAFSITVIEREDIHLLDKAIHCLSWYSSSCRDGKG